MHALRASAPQAGALRCGRRPKDRQGRPMRGRGWHATRQRRRAAFSTISFLFSFPKESETQALWKRVKVRKCRNEKSFSDPGAREVFVRQVPGLLLQLSRDRSDAARRRAPGAA